MIHIHAYTTIFKYSYNYKYIGIIQKVRHSQNGAKYPPFPTHATLCHVFMSFLLCLSLKSNELCYATEDFFLYMIA